MKIQGRPTTAARPEIGVEGVRVTGPGPRPGRPRGTGKGKIKLISKLVHRRRVSRVTKGGRRFSVRVLVVLGDRSGRVGVGVSNAVLLREALGEARRRAVRGLVDVQVTKNSSIRHMTYGQFRAARVVLRPRPMGSGVVAGGAVRPVLEMAGLKNVTAKSLGSNSVVNSARATIDALERLVKVEPK